MNVRRYPKQQRLLNFKKQAVAATAHQPCYLPLTELQNLPPSKFDVILVDPPFSSSFTWDTLAALPVPTLAADPSFVFLWVGSGAGDGLERGREILYRWGYRRCEDVVWIKTNKDTNLGPGVCTISRLSCSFSHATWLSISLNLVKSLSVTFLSSFML